jgi:hypothetical protein
MSGKHGIAMTIYLRPSKFIDNSPAESRECSSQNAFGMERRHGNPGWILSTITITSRNSPDTVELENPTLDGKYK